METTTINVPTRAPRRFLPDDFELNKWDDIAPYVQNLADREVGSQEDLESWLKDGSELYAVVEESQAWRYIRMTIDTKNEEAAEDYSTFIGDVLPKLSPFSNELNKKLAHHPVADQLNAAGYDVYLRGVRKSLSLYREKNVPLMAADREEARKFGVLTGSMTIDWDGEPLTMQQAGSRLKSTDRAEREKVYRLICERRLQDTEALDELFSTLAANRHEIAKNADQANFRDYKFESLGRFDYSAEDCFDFHKSIAEEIVPIVKEFQQARRSSLGLEVLRPWDTEVDTSGREMLTPFEGGEDLIEKTITVFNRLRPYFGECLEIMREMGHLDLESKQGKAPGGYNYPLYEIGVPFIFMNAVGSARDVVTMVHEGGHAVHSFLTRELDLTAFKDFPSEVAELASMAMELISMEHWDVYYPDPEDLKRAKREQLEKIFAMLPWVAIIDQFQHWVYENPGHSVEDRKDAWNGIMDRFSTGEVDHSGFEARRATQWQSQLHVFEMPFYYIEYGMAQLGAIAVWRNFKQDPEKALDQYMDALSLGYTATIPEIYEAAGIRFDFSAEYVRELAAFVREELAAL